MKVARRSPEVASTPGETRGATEEAAPDLCPSCGEPLRGSFCHECGEEASHRRDLSLKHRAGRAFQEAADFEHSKTFRTFAALLLKPGFLTAEYVDGRRKLYLSPLKICLLALSPGYHVILTGIIILTMGLAYIHVRLAGS